MTVSATGDQLPLYKLDSPEAKHLAEMLITLHDLTASFNSLKLWHEKYTGENMTQEQIVVATSLFRDGIVQFIGCFGSESHKLPPHIYASYSGGPEYFRWLKDLRDSYAAHSFGPLRQCVVGALVRSNGDSKEVAGIGHLRQIYIAPASSGSRQVVEFVNIAKEHVQNQVAQLQAEVQRLAQIMPSSELSKLQIARTYGVDPLEIRSSRDKFVTQKARGNTESGE